jgi:hypothetical protein
MDLGTDVEVELRLLSERLTEVVAEECLYCYLVRMLGDFGCAGGHRFSDRWAAAQRRAMPRLVSWLVANGGCCCDCEVVLNVFRPGRRSQRHRRLQCEASYEEVLRIERAAG